MVVAAGFAGLSGLGGRAAAAVTVADGSADSAPVAAPVDLGAAGWTVLTSATATRTGAQISTPGFATAGWHPVAVDDGGGPGTEIEALLQNGKCPDVSTRTATGGQLLRRQEGQ
ncbi:hypothetical protein [Streptacidiphilus cavernicola]|uniref:Uncharacterized protein n=1 Tax=Streptacidiphilus cavernicola TaxID=3342716 RepID=A0ABV6VSD5_9ACTN